MPRILRGRGCPRSRRAVSAFFKVGRIFHIGGFVLPPIGLTGIDFHLLPEAVTREHVGVARNGTSPDSRTCGSCRQFLWELARCRADKPVASFCRSRSVARSGCCSSFPRARMRRLAWARRDSSRALADATRPSKLRFPDSTAAATRSPSVTAFATASGSGPELPMHVVQPYPTRSKPSLFSGLSKPERER